MEPSPQRVLAYSQNLTKVAADKLDRSKRRGWFEINVVLRHPPDAFAERRPLSGIVTPPPSPQGNGSVRGHLVRLANASGKLPRVLVVHENRGLNPYIEDVA
jgi:hypothetical protein